MREHHVSRRRLARPSLLAGSAFLLALATSGAATTNDGGGTGEIRNASVAQAVPGSYIVVFEDSEVRANDVRSTAKSLAGKHNAKVKFTYDTALRGFSAKMSAKAASKLAANPRVAYVEQDGIAKAVDTQENPTWGLDRIDQENLPLDDAFTYPDSAGEGVNAYVIDTGIRTSHQDFGGRAESGYDFIGNDPDANDCNGHGTHVAGTVGSSTYGVAKQSTLVGVRVLNCQGSGQWSQIIAGIDWVADNASQPAVANMSLGGGANSSVDDAVRGLISSGVTTVVAAGNANRDACNYSPARTPEAITVGATKSNDERPTDWPNGQGSNYGSCLDIFAPGDSITSTWISSDSATNSISGTSMASPHVAGAAALHLALNSGDGPQQVASALTGNATDGVVGNPGSGSTNKLLNISYLNDGGDPDPEPTCDKAGNSDDVSIPDAGDAVTSTVEFADCTDTGTSSTQVPVSIKHSYTGDLEIDLIAPSGTVYSLKDAGGQSSVDLDETYTVDTSSEARDGVWKLRVRDVYDYDTGKIDSFGVIF